MAKKVTNHIPNGMTSMTIQLIFNGDCKDAIKYYQKVFGATMAEEPVYSPDGEHVWHAILDIGNSKFFLNDRLPGSYEQGPSNYSTCGIWLYVDDCDAWFNRAVENGAEVTMQLADTFWGDRMGKVKDPFGHSWEIATHQVDYSVDEIRERMHQFLGEAIAS